MNNKKIHPAWIMFALCCVIQFSGGGILSGSFAIFTPVVCEDMGWAIGEYSFHLSLTSYVMAANWRSGILSGYLPPCPEVLSGR